ncbi:hypothetical protein Ahy_A07g032717 [Arachis hypogaea]|uniref:RNase H type-1 domain-containing protein n=1 Tax=Arachis hypogaea TaxID=3818 RepID=A0A445C7E1_ARAHY|nr:hypothetical protein Ahy_A07g032717 [Arachis hypogaea]
MWTIWKTRNNHVYNNIKPNPKSTINNARKIELKYNSQTNDHIYKGTKSGATASVIRDHSKRILGGSATEIQVSSSLSTEAQAVKEAEIDSIIQDIKSIQKRLPNCGFTWAPREGNIQAHSLATLKLQNQLPTTWPTTPLPPPPIANIIRRDGMGLSFQNSLQKD